MMSKRQILVFCLVAILRNAGSQTSSVPVLPKDRVDNVVVPTEVAAILRPVLDALQRYRAEGSHDESQLDTLFVALSKKKGRLADEALVVLMCFDMGESQEETDAVIARGKKMLPLIEKYREKNPRLPLHANPEPRLKGLSRKADDFEGAVKAINLGWKGTWDSPEG